MRFRPFWLLIFILGAVVFRSVVGQGTADPVPSHVVLTPAGDPAVSAAVTWRAAESTVEAKLQIARATPGPDIEKDAKTFPASFIPLNVGDRTFRQYRVTLQNLQPDTLYAYRVANGTTWSEWYQFRTAATQPRPFRFIYLGDAQTDIRGRCSRVVRQALIDCPDARLILHAGDLTNGASSDTEWAEWFYMLGSASASILNVPAIGNHQYERAAPDSDQRRLAPHWHALFELPRHGVEGVQGSSYTFDFQGVRFVVLNSMEKIQEQASWLDKVLSPKNYRWSVVMFHHPVFSGAKGRDNKVIRETWKPILDRHKVDLVLTGHDHVYGRSNPFAGPAQGHPIHITSVVGAKQYDAGDRTWAARFGQDLQLYQIVTVDGNRLHFVAKTADGALYDEFVITKQANRVRFEDRSKRLGPEKLRASKSAANN